jgi:hypothetical protein
MQRKTLTICGVIMVTMLIMTNTYATAHGDIDDGDEDVVMCTMEVMECPDGTVVGRTAPTCAFICPGATSSQPLDGGVVTDLSSAATTSRAADMAERRDDRVELRSERRAALTEVRQKRIINLAANLSNRMDASTERLFSIISRLETRIQKLEQNGVVTDAAEDKLREAAQAIAEAKSLLGDIDTLVYSATTSEAPQADWQNLRTHYQTIATKIREAHALLRETIALLKIAVNAHNSTGVRDAVRTEPLEATTTRAE